MCSGSIECELNIKRNTVIYLFCECSTNFFFYFIYRLSSRPVRDCRRRVLAAGLGFLSQMRIMFIISIPTRDSWLSYLGVLRDVELPRNLKHSNEENRTFIQADNLIILVTGLSNSKFYVPWYPISNTYKTENVMFTRGCILFVSLVRFPVVEINRERWWAYLLSTWWIHYTLNIGYFMTCV